MHANKLTLSPFLLFNYQTHSQGAVWGILNLIIVAHTQIIPDNKYCIMPLVLKLKLSEDETYNHFSYFLS